MGPPGTAAAVSASIALGDYDVAMARQRETRLGLAIVKVLLAEGFGPLHARFAGGLL